MPANSPRSSGMDPRVAQIRTRNSQMRESNRWQRIRERHPDTSTKPPRSAVARTNPPEDTVGLRDLSTLDANHGGAPVVHTLAGPVTASAEPLAAPSRRVGPVARFFEARRRARAARAAHRLKEGYPGIHFWNSLRRPFVTGEGFKVLSYAAATGAAVAPVASFFVHDPGAKAHVLEAGAGLGASVVGFRALADIRSADFSTRGMIFLKDAATNPPFAEKAEHDLVRRFAQDPQGTMKLYKTTPLGIAAVYSVLHKRRKSPNGGYNMSVHEDSDKFRQVIAPILRYHVLRRPEFADAQIDVITRRHGFKVSPEFLASLRASQAERPYEAARKIAIPDDLAALLPSCLQHANPNSLRELEDIVLFSAAVIRAKQNKFKKNGVTKGVADLQVS